MTTQTGKAVTLIGLGDMGTALAHALLRNGYQVTVWNRSANKAAPLAAAGAKVAATAAAAVAASPITLICVTNYNISKAILQDPEVTTALQGRLLVELSSGTPQEARESETWAKAHGIDYLDGAILATPSQIGRPDTPIFVSGAHIAWAKSETPLRAIAGGVQYMGEDPGAASTWDLGFLSTLFGAITGFFHGAKVFQAEGIPVDALGNMILHIAPVLGEMIKHQGDTIQSGNYGNAESTLDICANGMDLFIKHAGQAGITVEIPTFIKKILKRGQDAGYGSEQVAAAFKTL